MFEATFNAQGEVLLSGRFDASQVEVATNAFTQINKSCLVNFKDLEYISSAGLSVLLVTQKRLKAAGHALKLINLNKHIRDVFRYAGFDTVFEIE